MLSEDKRQAIMRSATQVFCEKGLHQAKVEEIAQRAGIAKGTIYLYFASKEEIFRSVLHTHVDELLAAIKAIVGSEITPEEKLLAFARLQLREISLLVRIAYSAVSPELINEPMYKEMLVIQKRIQSQIAAILTEGVEQGVFRQIDAMHAAFCFQGILRIHLESALLEATRTWDEESMAEKICGLFLDGIRA